jgi:hypothetical protein
LRDVESINYGHDQPIQKENLMNKFYKSVFAAVLVVLVAVVLSVQVVQALRDWAAPPPLPYGLTMQDTMASVEQRLGQPMVTHALQAGWQPGLPDEGRAPDHVHYRAVYKRFGLTVVYNSPSPSDKNASIKEILLHK